MWRRKDSLRHRLSASRTSCKPISRLSSKVSWMVCLSAATQRVSLAKRSHLKGRPLKACIIHLRRRVWRKSGCVCGPGEVVLTTAYNCAQIKLTVPRDGCSLWEMPFNISAGDSHDQEQDSEQDTRLSR